MWERELDIYGKVRKEFTHDVVKDRRSGFMPFLYTGQYYDKETELAYNRFRYYSPDTGAYISQDPIGLAGGNPTLYGYVFDINTEVDVFGLSTFISKILVDGSVFRGVRNGQSAFSPSIDDITHYKTTGQMAGLSVKPKLNSQTIKFFEKIEADVLEINISSLKNLEVIQDGKEHASIRPSENYLKENNLTMIDALEDWNKEGALHPLSIELSKSVKCS